MDANKEMTMTMTLTVAQVDAIVDLDDDGYSVGTALADALDRIGGWDWSDESEHDPSDRMAVVESSGAYWLVYRGTESDSAERFGHEAEARRALRRQAREIVG